MIKLTSLLKESISIDQFKPGMVVIMPIGSYGSGHGYKYLIIYSIEKALRFGKNDKIVHSYIYHQNDGEGDLIKTKESKPDFSQAWASFLSSNMVHAMISKRPIPFQYNGAAIIPEAVVLKAMKG